MLARQAQKSCQARPARLGMSPWHFFLLALDASIVAFGAPLALAESVSRAPMLAFGAPMAKVPPVVRPRGGEEDDENNDDRKQHRVGRLHGVSWARGGDDYSRAAIKAPRPELAGQSYALYGSREAGGYP